MATFPWVSLLFPTLFGGTFKEPSKLAVREPSFGLAQSKFWFGIRELGARLRFPLDPLGALVVLGYKQKQQKIRGDAERSCVKLPVATGGRRAGRNVAGAACCRPDGVGRCLRHAGRGPSRLRRGRCQFGRATLFFLLLLFSRFGGGPNISSRFFPPKRSFCVFPFGFLQNQRVGASLTTSGPRHQDALREAAWLGAAAGAEICGPGCGALSSTVFLGG